MTGYNMMAPDSTADNLPRIYGERETEMLLRHNLKVEVEQEAIAMIN
jgi:hypothetical protein